MPIQADATERDPESLARRWTTRARMIREGLVVPPLALDLGSENARMTTSDPTSPLVSIPSCVVLDNETESIVAVGTEAQRMIGRIPSGLRLEFPIQMGVVAGPNLTEVLIRNLLARVIRGPRLRRRDIIVASPADATSVQLHALVAAARAAGGRRVILMRASLAAALGAGLPVLEPRGSLIVEMGAQKTEIAVIALGGIVVSSTLPMGSVQISHAIANYLRQEHHMLIGRSVANALKIEIGHALAPIEPEISIARGRDVLRSRPALVEIKAGELVPAIQEVLELIGAEIRSVLERTPPELSSDIARSGIHLSGGGSRLQSVAGFFEKTIGLPAQRVFDPQEAVVRGCQRCANDPELLREVSGLT